MSWEVLIPIIVSEGLLVAERLWQLSNRGEAPTQAEWDALKVLGKQNAKSKMLLALANNGIDPESERGKALLALT